MVCTTRISPITVITVVEVVGVMPSMQTSLGLPVLRHTSDSCASGLSGFPVMTINFSFGFRLCASCVSSTISRVLPELEMSSAGHSPAGYPGLRAVLRWDAEIRKECRSSKRL